MSIYWLNPDLGVGLEVIWVSLGQGVPILGSGTLRLCCPRLRKSSLEISSLSEVDGCALFHWFRVAEVRRGLFIVTFCGVYKPAVPDSDPLFVPGKQLGSKSSCSYNVAKHVIRIVRVSPPFSFFHSVRR